jgi:hypothetical protein
MMTCINDNDNESISNIIDIESQNETKEEKIFQEKIIQTPLKGILRKTEHYNEIEQSIHLRLFRLCASLLLIIIVSPIAICDLYFGFIDNSCSNENPDKVNISLRLYLLVCGFICLASLLVVLLRLWFIPLDNTINYNSFCSNCCYNVSISGFAAFNTIWNILGAIIFWGYIYINGNCNINFSTYVFVSLIIKFVLNFMAVFTSNRNK